MTFNQFLACARPSEKIERDFVREAQMGDALPDFACWKELESYLQDCSACAGALRAISSAAVKANAPRYMVISSIELVDANRLGIG